MAKRNEIIILGIDPGYDRLGVAIIKKSQPRDEVLFSDCLQTNAKDEYADRLVSLGNELEKILGKWQPTESAIEKLYFTVNQKTAMKVAGAIGLISYLIKKRNIPLAEYTPLQIKSCVTGFGGANKNQITSLIPRLVKIDKTIKYDDEFDAIAVAITHSVLNKNL